MRDEALTTPVAFIIFNRPHPTAQVFAEISKAKPTKLLVIADGPRPNRPDDVEKCQATRAIIDQIDWPCELLTNFSEINLGCRNRVSSGLDWVFEQVEQAIILEDDCLPHPTFFRFCDELLEKYRDDERVMMITGTNFQFGRYSTDYSYYFSHFYNIWGWATWRRSWQHFDVDMKLWPLVRDIHWLKNLTGSLLSTLNMTRAFDLSYKNLSNSWAFPWAFSCMVQNGLVTTPNVNLISNIGFGADAAHASYDPTGVFNLGTQSINFPLQHPPYVIRNIRADQHVMSLPVKPKVLFKRFLHRVKTLL